MAATLRTRIMFPRMLPSSCLARNICVRPKFCVQDAKNVSETSETHCVRAAHNNVATFATDGEHRRTQCCRHNVSSFCRGLTGLRSYSAQQNICRNNLTVARLTSLIRQQYSTGLMEELSNIRVNVNSCAAFVQGSLHTTPSRIVISMNGM